MGRRDEQRKAAVVVVTAAVAATKSGGCRRRRRAAVAVENGGSGHDKIGFGRLGDEGWRWPWRKAAGRSNYRYKGGQRGGYWRHSVATSATCGSAMEHSLRLMSGEEGGGALGVRAYSKPSAPEKH